MDNYKNEWVELLLNQVAKNWLIASDRNHIFINIPDDQDLDLAINEFQRKVQLLKTKIKSKPVKLGFFLGNSVDSKFYELN